MTASNLCKTRLNGWVAATHGAVASLPMVNEINPTETHP